MATAPLTRMAVLTCFIFASLEAVAAEEISTCSAAERDAGGNCPGESDDLEYLSLLQSRTTLSRNIAASAGESRRRQRLWSTFKSSMAVKSQPKTKANVWQMRQMPAPASMGGTGTGGTGTGDYTMPPMGGTGTGDYPVPPMGEHGDHHDFFSIRKPCPVCGEPSDPASCLMLCSASCTNNDETCLMCAMENNCMYCHDCMSNQHADQHHGHGDHHDDHGDHHDGGSGSDGESMCENHGHGKDACDAVGCCHFNEREGWCFSSVGRGLCTDTNPCPSCGEPTDPGSCLVLCNDDCSKDDDEACFRCASNSGCMDCHDCILNQHADHHDGHGDHHDDHGDHHHGHGDHHDVATTMAPAEVTAAPTAELAK